jgi:Ran GTPase-activating protein (RanGAP) involved in mRNA processing and transport
MADDNSVENSDSDTNEDVENNNKDDNESVKGACRKIDPKVVKFLQCQGRAAGAIDIRLCDALQIGSWATATYVANAHSCKGKYSSYNKNRTLNLNLTTLCLNEVKLGSFVLESILDGVKENPILSNLHLNDVIIDDDGMRILAKAIKLCISLTKLSITGCNITTKGALYLSKALSKSSSRITCLNLKSNELGSEGTSVLAEYLKSNLKFLQNLDLSDNYIGNKGAKYIGKLLAVNKTISNVALCDNRIDSIGVRHIIAGIKSNKRKVLKHLSLNENRIDSDGVRELMVLSGQLKSLDLTYKFELEVNDSKHIGRSLLQSNLSTLRFSENSSDSDVVDSELHFIKYFSKSLSKNTSLTELDLMGYSLSGIEGTRILVDALRSNNTLKTLCVAVNFEEIDPLTLSDPLINALASNTIGMSNLKLELLLMQNSSLEVMKLIRDMLKTNKTLTGFQLKWNDMDFEGVSAMVNGLDANSTLVSFDLSENGINDEEAKCLALGLKNNKTLKDLNLSFNRIRDNGVEHLVGSLDYIETLNLSHNRISIKGAKWISQHLLKPTCRIHNLNLSNNEIGSTGGELFGLALESNRSLLALNLTSNSLGNDGVAGLAHGLVKNPYLRDLAIGKNNVDFFHRNSLALPKLIERNLHGRNATKQAALCLLAIKKYIPRNSNLISSLPQEIVKMIACCIWDTRGQIEWIKNGN